MKVGQWVRYENVISRFVGFCDCGFCQERGFLEPIFEGCYHYFHNEKEWLKAKQKCIVANTPQELIQVGDLVVTRALNVLPVIKIHNDVELLKSYEDTFRFDVITEISTLTDKDTYKCQWRKSNE